MDSSLPEIKNLDKIFSSHLNKQVKILKQDSKILTAPGENFGSIMMALFVTTIDEQNLENKFNLVAKTIPTNEMLKEVFQIQISFVKELSVYTKIVPTLKQLEDEFNIVNRASELFCKCYGGRNNLDGDTGTVDENSVILLENLKLNDYNNGDRLHGFDYETSVLVLQNLARFHAEPIALKILKPNVFKDTIGAILGVEAKPNKTDADKIDSFISGLLEIIVNDEQHLVSYANKVAENIRLTLSGDMYYPKENPEKPFVTFGHSDFWVNNMMIRKDQNGNPLNLKIIDFQTPVQLSLVCDLLFFMYSSISPEALYGNEDELLHIYYDSFINCLNSFNLNDLEDYTWDKFESEVKIQSTFVLNQILFMYKVILLERGQITDMNDFSEDDMFSFNNVSENCKSRMRKTFETFVRRGWLD